jgi:hypothetical protein
LTLSSDARKNGLTSISPPFFMVKAKGTLSGHGPPSCYSLSQFILRQCLIYRISRATAADSTILLFKRAPFLGAAVHMRTPERTQAITATPKAHM